MRFHPVPPVHLIAFSIAAVLAAALVFPIAPAAAQEITPSPQPTIADNTVDNTGASAGATMSAADLADALARAEAAAAAATLAAERAERGVDVASNFLGLFEVLGFVVTVGGGAAAIFGITRLFQAQQQLVQARDEFKQELDSTLKQFNAATQAQQIEVQHTRVAASRALAFLILGERQFKAGDNAGALVTYHQAAELDPNNPLIHYRLGYVCVHSKQFHEAMEHLRRALELDPDFPPALAAQGFTWRRLSENLPPGVDHNEGMNTAEGLLIRALKLAPKLVDENGESWWGSLGGLYKRENNPEKAIFCYEQAAAVTPQSSYPFSNLALLYTQAGNLAAVQKTYTRVEKLAQAETTAEVDNYWAANDLLTARLALGKWDEADRALALVLETTPRGKDGLSPLEALHDTLTALAASLSRDPERADSQARFTRALAQIAQAIASRRSLADPAA